MQQHFLGGGEAVARAALDHVAGQCPRRRGKAEHRHVRSERAAELANGVAEEFRFDFGIEFRERFDLFGGAHGRMHDRSGVAEFDGRAHGFGDDENIGEDDDGVHAEAAMRLQRDFGGEIGRLGDFEEAVLLADGAVFGQVASRLAHHPHRHARDGLVAAGTQEQLFGAERCGSSGCASRFGVYSSDGNDPFAAAE